MLVLPVLAKLGWVRLAVPAFYPLGAVVGGYLFGLAMAWAGGCAAGVWYKWGEGRGGAFVAVLGLALGAVATELGPLRGLREQVQGALTSEAIQSATLSGLVGAEWAVYPTAALILFWLVLSRVTTLPRSWTWLKTGILMGLLGVIAWPLSALSGRIFGMAVVPGSVNALEFVSRGDVTRLNWDVFFVLAIPVGAYLAARRQGPVSSDPVSGKEAARAFGGGLLLGIGASLAGGCTVGHSLVGVSLLSVGSLVTTVFIVLGSWTVGYFEMRTRRGAESGLCMMNAAIDGAATQLQEAAAAKKCWGCGCLHSSLRAIEAAFPEVDRPATLNEAIEAARKRLTEVVYDCLGCPVCYPALAINALKVEVDTCPTEEAEERKGWPPLPGDYTVLRYQAPVSVCTLTDAELAREVASAAGSDVTIVGTLQTENLGIERLILNVLANPNIRFLVVCGPDSRQTIGHLPGQSLVALDRAGLDERSRIVGARGKRPVIRNISREAVEHFRRTVEVVDLVGDSRLSTILDAVRRCAARNPGPAEPFAPEQVVEPLTGYVPERMVSDPVGYFVIYVDRSRRLLSMEHYQNNGLLDVVIEGHTAAELYIPAIERGLVSRLDHAAYLGRELARAEQALRSGASYIQDAAPERRNHATVTPRCGCESECGDET